MTTIRNAAVCAGTALYWVLSDAGGTPSPLPPSPCPDDMVLADGFCIDVFEAPNIRGSKPLVMVNAIEAEAWCAQRSKRLCTSAEWTSACSGPDRTKYPYGNRWKSGSCNDERPWIDRDESKLNQWPRQAAVKEADRVWQGDLSGSRDACVSGYGVRDMVGNVEEWTSGDGGKHVLMGCFWNGCSNGKKPGCGHRNVTHASVFRYYETGMRCCRSLENVP